MGATTPFAETPSAPEPIIAQVRRLLADDVPRGMSIETTYLDRVADHAVRELWSSRVKTFVPVLALRTAREMLRDEDLLPTAESPAVGHVERQSTAMRQQVERPDADVLSISGDVITLDDRDVLSR